MNDYGCGVRPRLARPARPANRPVVPRETLSQQRDRRVICAGTAGVGVAALWPRLGLTRRESARDFDVCVQQGRKCSRLRGQQRRISYPVLCQVTGLLQAHASIWPGWPRQRRGEQGTTGLRPQNPLLSTSTHKWQDGPGRPGGVPDGCDDGFGWQVATPGHAARVHAARAARDRQSRGVTRYLVYELAQQLAGCCTLDLVVEPEV